MASSKLDIYLNLMLNGCNKGTKSQLLVFWYIVITVSNRNHDSWGLFDVYLAY